MATIIGLCGSLRRESFNQKLLTVAMAMAPAGSAIVPGSIREFPLYDADVESERGMPSAVQRLKDQIARADGLLIVTPEYNASIPGVLKNAIDWLSRPAEDIARVFRGRPVAVIGATVGIGGTALAQAAWLPIFSLLGMRPWLERPVLISSAETAFDGDGDLINSGTRVRLQKFVEGFVSFADAERVHVDPYEVMKWRTRDDNPGHARRTTIDDARAALD